MKVSITILSPLPLEAMRLPCSHLLCYLHLPLFHMDQTSLKIFFSICTTIITTPSISVLNQVVLILLLLLLPFFHTTTMLTTLFFISINNNNNLFLINMDCFKILSLPCSSITDPYMYSLSISLSLYGLIIYDLFCKYSLISNHELSWSGTVFCFVKEESLGTYVLILARERLLEKHDEHVFFLCMQLGSPFIWDFHAIYVDYIVVVVILCNFIINDIIELRY